MDIFFVIFIIFKMTVKSDICVMIYQNELIESLSITYQMLLDL